MTTQGYGVLRVLTIPPFEAVPLCSQEYLIQKPRKRASERQVTLSVEFKTLHKQREN